MFNMKFDWKEFRIYLPSLDAWLRGNISHYVGNSAGANLVLHFSQTISVDDQVIVGQYFTDSLDEAGETAKFEHVRKLDLAIAESTAAIPNLEWDQMLPSERKIMMRSVLSDADKEAILVKYPQV